MIKRVPKDAQWGKDSLLNKWCWKNRIYPYKRIKLDPQLKPYTKLNSKYIKDLYVSPSTVEVIEENIGKNYMTLALGMIFFWTDTKNRGKKSKK